MVIHEHSSSSSRSAVTSYGSDIQPDLKVTSDYVKVERLGDYVKVEDYKRWKEANDELMRRSFIFGVVLGIFVLVAIIMAGVSLQKSGKNA